MSVIRDSLEDPWYRAMYVRYSQPNNPDNRNYQKGGYNGIESPIFIDANQDYAIELSRHDSICPYKIGNAGDTDPRAERFNTRSAQNCCKYSGGAPYQCILAQKRQPVITWGRYDHMG
jgi:hypothetical protein